MIDRIEFIFGRLDSAPDIADVAAVRSFRIHALKGALKGYWAATVRANWRIIFRMEGDEVSDVDFLDYH